MTLGIGKKYALWFSAISLIILSTVLLTTIIVIWRSSDILKERLRAGTVENFEAFEFHTMSNLAEYLRSELFVPLYELDIDSITRSTRDLRRGMPILSVRVADATGKVLTDGTPENASYGIRLQLDREALEVKQVLIQPVPAGHRVTFRIGIEEYTAGYGEIVFSDSPLKRAIARHDDTVRQIWNQFRSTFLRIAVTWALIVILLALLISILFSRTLSLPLISLRDATRRIAKGDLDYRVEVASRDELGELAVSLNRMGADLQKRTAELARTNEALHAEIEERKETENALRESEQRLALAQKAGRVGVFDWDPINREGVWTQQTEELHGLPPGGFEGKYEGWASHVHPDDLPRLEAQLQDDIREHRTQHSFEYRYLAPDGRTRWIAGTAQLTYKHDGTADRLIGTTVDITDLKEYQLQLSAAKDAAEAANQAKSEFLANMSHEMRTPLAGALGMIDLVLEMEIGAEERQMLEMAKRSSESLLRLISDLLEFARLEAGILRFEHKTFSVAEPIRTAMEVVSLQAREKGLHLSWRVEESVPELVNGDEGRLRQVLVNLLGNSVKFTEKGEVEVTVHRFCDWEKRETNYLLFSVRDTGIGIPLDKRENIFGKFIQIDPTSRRKYGGAGLGLALSRQIIEKMGGKIWTESATGRGSIFHFSYPLESVPGGEDENTGR